MSEFNGNFNYEPSIREEKPDPVLQPHCKDAVSFAEHLLINYNYKQQNEVLKIVAQTISEARNRRVDQLQKELEGAMIELKSLGE